MKGDKGPSVPFSPKRARETWDGRQKKKSEARGKRTPFGNITGLGAFKRFKTKGETLEAQKAELKADEHKKKWDAYKNPHPPIAGGSGESKTPAHIRQKAEPYINNKSIQPGFPPIKHGNTLADVLSETKPINTNIPTTISTRHPAESTTNTTPIPPRPTPKKEEPVKTKPGGPGGQASWTNFK